MQVEIDGSWSEELYYVKCLQVDARGWELVGRIILCLTFVGRREWEWVGRIILFLMFAGRN